MGNIVIVTHWLDGDVIPFIRIGKELRKRGHKVTIITHCKFGETAKKAGLDFEAWDTPEEYETLVEDMSLNKADSSSENNYSYSSSKFRQKYENTNRRMAEYEKIIKYCEEPNTAILCKNRSSIAAYMVAEKLGIPLATVMMNPMEVTSMLMYEKLEGKNDVDRLNTLRRKVDLSDISSWLQWESSAKMTLALWPEWYDTESDEWPSEIQNVGFPLEKGKEEVQRDIPAEFEKWIDKNPKPIVITGGTTKCIDNKFYSRSVAACGLAGYPTVVLTRYKELIPEELPSNVVWFDYLPLDKILPQASLLIHHGGIGTLSGALAAGVPQLILPCYVDRPYNASLIKKLGAGDYLYVANWTPEKIAEKIEQVQLSNIRVKCKEYVHKMQENHGVTRAADFVEKLLTDKKYIYSLKKSSHLAIDDISGSSNKNSEKPTRTVIKNLTDEQRRKLLINLHKRQG